MSQANVLDNNHGIERVVRNNTSYGVAYTSGEPEVKFLPWYTKILGSSRNGYVTQYYTRVGGWERVECSTWEAAYNHIARSRGLPTSKQVGSTYVQEARNAGVELPETKQHVLTTSEQANVTYGLLVSNVGWVVRDDPDYAKVKALFDEYAATKQYEQVTMWSSAEHDPIEEAYNEEKIAELNADPWYHPRWDDMPELEQEW